MRAKDFITEKRVGKLPSDQKSTLNRSNKFATSNDRFYDLNRVMMAPLDQMVLTFLNWIQKVG